MKDTSWILKDILPENLTINEIEILKNNLEHIFFENLSENRSGIIENEINLIKRNSIVKYDFEDNIISKSTILAEFLKN